MNVTSGDLAVLYAYPEDAYIPQTPDGEGFHAGFDALNRLEVLGIEVSRLALCSCLTPHCTTRGTDYCYRSGNA